MKTLKFLQIMLLAALCSGSSCQEDDDKLPGTKPEILLGKWRGKYEASFLASPLRHFIETYEFTSGGGSIETIEYFPSEDRYEDIYTNHFTDWSYDGKDIHFLKKKGSFTSKWSQPIYELNTDYFSLGSVYSSIRYRKVTE